MLAQQLQIQTKRIAQLEEALQPPTGRLLLSESKKKGMSQRPSGPGASPDTPAFFVTHPIISISSGRH